VVVCQFAPAGVAGQFRQLPQAGIHIEAIDVKAVVLERGQIAASAGQAIDSDFSGCFVKLHSSGRLPARP